KSVNGADTCIIDCQGSETDPHRGFIFESFETESAVLDGFTIQNAYWIQYEPYISAAGIHVAWASPTIQNCIIRNCVAHTAGGVLLGVSNSLLLNCEIRDNSAGDYAGGLDISTLANPVVANCLITGNFANLGGGGVCVGFDSRPIIFNCTITLNNTSRGHGGGLHVYNSDLSVFNCILWDNPPEEIAYWGEIPNVRYSDVKDGFFGQGNIDANPRFVQGVSGSYCLSQIAAGQTLDSPCVDAGNDLAELICCPFYQEVICMDDF
ncbi:MAG TPA: right-handed parallel beta-helix repeat-containing protein, partial [bacterium]|nr:right-handed parallel beta-helix repeat-containing protein [bacterium]